MPQFDPEVAHDVLIPMAEAAYLPSLPSDSLPSGYEVVGPIKVSRVRAAIVAAQASTSPAPAPQLVERMRQDGDGLERSSWVPR